MLVTSTKCTTPSSIQAKERIQRALLRDTNKVRAPPMENHRRLPGQRSQRTSSRSFVRELSGGACGPQCLHPFPPMQASLWQHSAPDRLCEEGAQEVMREAALSWVTLCISQISQLTHTLVLSLAWLLWYFTR